MARKVRRTRRKAGSARKRLKRNKGTRAGALKGWRKRRAKSRKSTAAKPRKRRRKVSKTKRRVTARKAPKRKKRRAKAKLKANPRRRRRLRRNYGTRKGAKRGWRTRKAKYKATAYRKKSSKRRKRAKAKSTVKRKRRKSARKPKLRANRRRRSSRRRLSSNRRRRSYRSNKRRALSPNRRRRAGTRRRRSHRRSHRRNGTRKFFRKNGISDTLKFVAVTGGVALGGFVTHKLSTNLLTKLFNKFLGSPATVVSTPSGQAIVAAPATSGLGALNIDPGYQKLGASALVALLGCLAAGKLIKNPNTRNAAMTGIAVSFTHSIFQVVAGKFFPQYADMLSGADDGTAARLSAMYGLGASIMPRYSAINGMGEYFQGGTAGLGEYFEGSTAGLGEYFQGTSGLGATAYEAAAGMGSYGGNPDLMEAAAGMGAAYAANTSHVDPHGDLDRELNIAEAAAGVGALPSYEASAGFGNVTTVPSTSTWIPGTSNGQIWAGTRAISNPQSSTEMVPAGILQTDGGQGVFG